MHPHLSPDPTTWTTPSRRSRPRAAGVLLATLLFVLAQAPSIGYAGQLSSGSALAGTVPVSGIAWSPSEAPAPSEATPRDHHTSVAGIPAPLALAVGAVVLVLVILLAITALTRHRHDDGNGFLDLER